MKQYQIFDTKSAAACLLLLFAPSLLLAQADSLRVTALNPVAGEASLYTLEFTLSDTLHQDAEFEVTFPAGFDLSRVTIAGSKAVNGGFSVEVDGQTVLVKRKGRGAVKLPGERVDVMFSTVTNPGTPQTEQEIRVDIRSKSTSNTFKEFNGTIAITEEKAGNEQ